MAGEYPADSRAGAARRVARALRPGGVRRAAPQVRAAHPLPGVPALRAGRRPPRGAHPAASRRTWLPAFDCGAWRRRRGADSPAPGARHRHRLPRTRCDPGGPGPAVQHLSRGLVLRPDPGRATGGGMTGFVIAGAGLGGALLGTLLGRAGQRVLLIERRPDPRRARPEAGRSINLALSARGLHALEAIGARERIERLATPLHGRMIHPVRGPLAFQPY